MKWTESGLCALGERKGRLRMRKSAAGDKASLGGSNLTPDLNHHHPGQHSCKSVLHMRGHAPCTSCDSAPTRLVVCGVWFGHCRTGDSSYGRKKNRNGLSGASQLQSNYRCASLISESARLITDKHSTWACL